MQGQHHFTTTRTGVKQLRAVTPASAGSAYFFVSQEDVHWGMALMWSFLKLAGCFLEPNHSWETSDLAHHDSFLQHTHSPAA